MSHHWRDTRLNIQQKPHPKSAVFTWQSTDKPGSVVDDHLSRLPVAKQLKRLSACERTLFYAGLLAAGRVYLFPMSP